MYIRTAVHGLMGSLTGEKLGRRHPVMYIRTFVHGEVLEEFAYLRAFWHSVVGAERLFGAIFPVPWPDLGIPFGV